MEPDRRAAAAAVLSWSGAADPAFTGPRAVGPGARVRTLPLRAGGGGWVDGDACAYVVSRARAGVGLDAAAAGPRWRRPSLTC
jgi:hypothetical protein